MLHPLEVAPVVSGWEMVLDLKEISLFLSQVEKPVNCLNHGFSAYVLFFLRAASDFVKLNISNHSRSYLTGSHTEKRHRESGQFLK